MPQTKLIGNLGASADAAGGELVAGLEAHRAMRTAGRPVLSVLDVAPALGLNAAKAWAVRAGGQLEVVEDGRPQRVATALVGPVHELRTNAVRRLTEAARDAGLKASPARIDGASHLERTQLLDSISRQVSSEELWALRLLLVDAASCSTTAELLEVSARLHPEKHLWGALTALRHLLPPRMILLAPDLADLRRVATAAVAIVEALPWLELALLARSRDLEAAWGGETDRALAVVREGAIAIAGIERRTTEIAVSSDGLLAPGARSAEESFLFERLESLPLTSGLFELNGRLEPEDGSRPLEVDLLAREERIAIEIDGYFHFREADDYRRDRRKDLLLQERGFLVIRFLAEDVASKLEEILDCIGAAVRRRQERRSR